MSYPDTPGFKGRIETGREAAQAFTPKLGRRQREALDALAEIGPATADEVANHIDRHFYVVRPRFSELREKGLVIDTGKRRATPFGGKTWEGRLATPAEIAVHLAQQAADAEKGQ